MNIAVIGAGASGIFAALHAAKNGSDVTLFERNPAIGRKLLVTGSGRCNITNDAAAASAYACADPQWMQTLLNRFGVPDLLHMLEDLGIPVTKTSDGWYYPLSDSAASVVETFSNALVQAGVKIIASAQVNNISVVKNGFSVSYLQSEIAGSQNFDRVIVSTGGKAYPNLGSRGELFPVLESLGHTVLPLRPALAPLLVDTGKLHRLEGMRLDVGVILWKESHQLAAARGNLIFTKWGLNGPAVMDISHQVSAHEGSSLELSLNLLTFFQDEYDRLLSSKRASRFPLRVFMAAFFALKVASVLLKYLELPADICLDALNDKALEKITSALQDIRLPVQGTRGFEYCQVSAGGVPVTEVDPLTLESRLVPGLYLTGETLDVVGPCGGYNLQYAFSSGSLAGMAAAGVE
jgi:hypothetical protein